MRKDEEKNPTPKPYLPLQTRTRQTRSNMFPGLFYRPSDLPIVVLIFFSGKVVITGAKTMADVYTGWSQLSQFLKLYKTETASKTKVTATATATGSAACLKSH
jgi:hypothetical protein